MIEIFNKYHKEIDVSHETVEEIYYLIAQDYQKKIQFINIIVLSDSELLKINKSYLNHDYYTDIITFDLSDNPLHIEAELYISYERIIENAEHKNIKNELYRVLIHGLLHIVGLKDKEETEIEEMRQKENYYLERCKYEI